MRSRSSFWLEPRMLVMSFSAQILTCNSHDTWKQATTPFATISNERKAKDIHVSAKSKAPDARLSFHGPLADSQTTRHLPFLDFLGVLESRPRRLGFFGLLYFWPRRCSAPRAFECFECSLGALIALMPRSPRTCVRSSWLEPRQRSI